MSYTNCHYCGKAAHDTDEQRLACRDWYYSASDALRAGPRAKVRLTRNAIFIIELDDRKDRCEALDIKFSYPTKKDVELDAPIASLMKVAEDFDDRGAGANSREGWDQPLSWFTSAKKAAQRIREAIAKTVDTKAPPA